MAQVTTTTVLAHSLKKGDMVVKFSGTYAVIAHPSLIGTDVEFELEYVKDRVIDDRNGSIKYYGHRHTETATMNEAIKILVGGNAGGL
jgi:hypothetical protein